MGFPLRSPEPYLLCGGTPGRPSAQLTQQRRSEIDTCYWRSSADGSLLQANCYRWCQRA